VSFTTDELLRYHRHLTLPEFGDAGQRRLKSARVLIVGVGGLGSPVAMYLAAAGVGAIGLVDFDLVEAANLQRQIIHGTPDIGASKVASAAAKLHALNPLVAVELHEEPFDAANARRLVTGVDVVVDGTDNFSTRYLVNDACVLAGKPNVYGSVFRFEGQASVFSAAGGPCYRCLHPEPPPAGLIPSCAEGGVLGVLPGIIGLVQATEAIKLITDVGEPLIGRLLLYDALKMRFREIVLPRDAQCPVCGTHPSIRELVLYDQQCADAAEAPAAHAPERERAAALSQERWGWGPGEREPSASAGGGAPAQGRVVGPREQKEITVEELNDWRTQARPHVLLDVREPSEYAICHIDDSLLIPLGQLPARLDVLPTDRPIVIHCKSGGRSARATAMLRAKGYDARNLAGGILAWAARIDPRLNRY
jgi:molybdopterin/thiamine biosynthesis adenylyltransferase/rhodanese-related sulfurtransferase